MKAGTLFAVLVLLGSLISPQLGPPTDIAPLWSHEVIEDFGYNHDQHFRPDVRLDNEGTGVVFLGEQELIVYALQPSGRLSSRVSHEISSGFRLRLHVLDAQTGKERLSKDVSVRSHGSAVQVTAGGILVNTGEVIKLFSADFSKVKNLTSPTNGVEGWLSNVSPTGTTILANRFNVKTNSSYLTVFDARTLEPKFSWNSPLLLNNCSISDRRIAALENGFVVRSDFGRTSWETIGKGAGICGGNVPIFYSDDALVYGCTKLIAASVEGGTLMAEELPREVRVLAKKAVAQKEQRVAVSLHTVEVKKHLLTEPSSRATAIHIAVYDLSQKKRILTVSVAPLPKNDYDFALSPDGSKLAVLNDRRASVYSVPVPASNGGAAQ